MENLFPERGTQIIRQRLRFTQIRTAAHPATAPYAEEVKGWRAEVTAAQEAVEEAEVQRMVAVAERHYEDGIANADTAEAVRVLLNDCKGDRNADDYKRVVPVAPSQGTRPTGGTAQGAYIRGIITNGRALANPSAAFLAALDILEATQGRMDAADAKVEATERALGAARVERDLLERRVCADYNHLFFVINQALPHQKALVESMFG
jgi:hypothetical protein